MSRNFLNSWAKPPQIREKSRNERFQELIKEARFSHRTLESASNQKKLLARDRRAKALRDNNELQELFNWMFEIQKALKLKDYEFATRLQISPRMLIHYKKRDGHFPSKRVFRKLLELERLCRNRVTIIKDKLTFTKSKAINTVVI